MASIKDIAKQLNMGVSTVSMALNDNPRISEETKKRVLDKAKELGYVKNGIAVDLQRQRTNTILLVVTDPSRSYFSRVINRVQKCVAESGYDLIIVPTEGSTRTAKKYISEHRCDGAFIFTNQIEDDFVRTYASKDFPIVLMGRYLNGENIYCDVYDSGKGQAGFAAVNFLLASGHKRIGFMNASMTTLGSPKRFQGYKMTMELNNIPIDENIIFYAGESTFEAGYKTTLKAIEKLDLMDALIYANDDIAIGGLKCLIEHGIRVPEDLSIIGSNNLPEAAMVTPALTTISNTNDDSIEFLVHVLIRALNNEEIDNQELIKHSQYGVEKVVERETVKKIRN